MAKGKHCRFSQGVYIVIKKVMIACSTFCCKYFSSLFISEPADLSSQLSNRINELNFTCRIRTNES